MPEEMATGAGLKRDPAQVALSEVFGLSKKDIDSLEVLGFLLYEQGRTTEAESIFAGLVTLDSKRSSGYAGMGALALIEQRIPDAVKWLQEAVSRAPEDPTVRANLGEALLKDGKFEAAAQEFERALQLDPEERDPGANRARAILSGMKIVVDELQNKMAQPEQPRQDG